MHCENVINPTSAAVGNRADASTTVHKYAVAKPSQFELQTPDRFFQKWDYLHQNFGRITKGQHKLTQMAWGLTYDPFALPLSARHRRRVNPIDHVFYDWMHCGLASGGHGQFVVELMCKSIVGHGIQVETLDHFSQTIHWPAGQHRFPPTFFRTRLSGADGGHVHAFASECMQALRALVLFTKKRAVPRGIAFL